MSMFQGLCSNCQRVATRIRLHQGPRLIFEINGQVDKVEATFKVLTDENSVGFGAAVVEKLGRNFYRFHQFHPSQEFLVGGLNPSEKYESQLG